MKNVHLRGFHSFLLVFPLGLGEGFQLSFGASVDDFLSVLVHLQLDNLDVRRVDSDLIEKKSHGHLTRNDSGLIDG